MRRSKKFLLVTVLAAVGLVGSITGVVLAQTGNGDGSQPDARLAKVCQATMGLAGSAGGITGLALAETGNGDDSQSEALPEKVGEVYEENTGVAVDSQELEKTFAQAQSDMRTEALKGCLQSLVDEGKMTQEQADQYLEWWQSKPNVAVGFDSGGSGGGGGLCAPQPSEQPSE